MRKSYNKPYIPKNSCPMLELTNYIVGRKQSFFMYKQIKTKNVLKFKYSIENGMHALYSKHLNRNIK